MPLDPSGSSSDPVALADLELVVLDEISEVLVRVEVDACVVEALVVVLNLVLVVLATVVLDATPDRELNVDELVADVGVVVLDCAVDVA
jgi:hypothetical protein